MFSNKHVYPKDYNFSTFSVLLPWEFQAVFRYVIDRFIGEKWREMWMFVTEAAIGSVDQVETEINNVWNKRSNSDRLQGIFKDPDGSSFSP